MGTYTGYGDHQREAVSMSPGYYQRFVEAGRTLKNTSQEFFKGYRLDSVGNSPQAGVTNSWWLRSVNSNRYNSAILVQGSGMINNSYTYNYVYDIAPCFSLNR